MKHLCSSLLFIMLYTATAFCFALMGARKVAFIRVACKFAVFSDVCLCGSPWNWKAPWIRGGHLHPLVVCPVADVCFYGSIPRPLFLCPDVCTSGLHWGKTQSKDVWTDLKHCMAVGRLGKLGAPEKREWAVERPVVVHYNVGSRLSQERDVMDVQKKTQHSQQGAR